MESTQQLLATFQARPKADRHNHLFLGGRRQRLETLLDVSMTDFADFRPEVCRNAGNTPSAVAIDRLNAWVQAEYVPRMQKEHFLEMAVSAALEAACEDRVVRLETSINLTFPERFRMSPESFLATLRKIHTQVAPEMLFCLDLGIVRTQPPGPQYDWLQRFLAVKSDFDGPAFRVSGLDIYDVENSFDGPFRKFYLLAAEFGLKRKAHIGEFGLPEDVRRTVEILNLEEVQHGVRAGLSPEVAAWLADRGTRLNVSPAGNRMLGAVDFTQKPHPLRVLHDAGVRLSVATDDLLLFGKNISQQCVDLVEEGVFSLDEMFAILDDSTLDGRKAGS